MSEKEIAMVIAEKSFTQDEAAIIAFKMLMQNQFHIDMAYLDWLKLIAQPDFQKKEYLFLLLYYLDRIADSEIQEMCKDDLRKIKEEIKRCTQMNCYNKLMDGR